MSTFSSITNFPPDRALVEDGRASTRDGILAAVTPGGAVYDEINRLSGATITGDSSGIAGRIWKSLSAAVSPRRLASIVVNTPTNPWANYVDGLGLPASLDDVELNAVLLFPVTFTASGTTVTVYYQFTVVA